MYLYTNLPVNAIVRLPHPWSGDTPGQEKIVEVEVYVLKYI